MVTVPVGQQEQAERQPLLPKEIKHLRGVSPGVEGHRVTRCLVPGEVAVHLHRVPIGGEHRHPSLALGKYDLTGMIIPQRQQAGTVQREGTGHFLQGCRIGHRIGLPLQQLGHLLHRDPRTRGEGRLRQIQSAARLADHIEPGVLQRDAAIVHAGQRVSLI